MTVPLDEMSSSLLYLGSSANHQRLLGLRRLCRLNYQFFLHRRLLQVGLDHEEAHAGGGRDHQARDGDGDQRRGQAARAVACGTGIPLVVVPTTAIGTAAVFCGYRR